MNDGESTKAWFCFILLLTCVGLVVSGVVMGLSSLDGTRQRLVTEYTASAGNWSGGARAQFSELAVNMTVKGTTWPLRRISVPPELPDHGTDLPQYIDLYYVSVGLPAVLVEGGWNEVPVAFTLNVTDATISSGLSVGDIPLARREVVHDNEKMCFLHKGVYDKTLQQCTMFEQIYSICVKMRQESDGHWALDGSGGGYSCRPGTENDWAPAQYTKVWRERDPRTMLAFERPPPQEIDPAEVRIEVRSVADPLLYAYRVTDDSLVFPAAGPELVAGGIWLAFTGAILSLPVLRFFYRYCRREHAEDAWLRGPPPPPGRICEQQQRQQESQQGIGRAAATVV